MKFLAAEAGIASRWTGLAVVPQSRAEVEPNTWDDFIEGVFVAVTHALRGIGLDADDDDLRELVDDLAEALWTWKENGQRRAG